MPSSFIEGGYVEPCAADPVDLVQWWAQFNDPLLTELVERSICCNLDLRIARERVCEARAIFGIEFSRLLPHIDEVTQIDRIRISQTLTKFPCLEGKFANFYRTGFDTNWEIDLWGKQTDRALASAYDFFAQKEDVRNVHLAVASEVATTYFIIRSLQERIEITKKHIASESALVEITQQRYDGGLAPLANLYLAKGLLDTRLSALPMQEHKLQRSIYSMAVLLGVIPEALAHTFCEIKDVPCTNGKIPLGLPSELLCRRGDVRRVEFLMRASGARVLASRKELFPEISLQAIYQMATCFYQKWFDRDSKQWALLPFISLPVFHGGGILSRIRADTSLQYQAVMEYERIVLIALKEMETSLNGYFKRSEEFRALENEVSDYQKARDLTEALYVAGLVDFLYVIDTERDLYFAEIRKSESKEELSTDLVAIYKALGGGWECPCSQ